MLVRVFLLLVRVTVLLFLGAGSEVSGWFSKNWVGPVRNPYVGLRRLASICQNPTVFPELFYFSQTWLA